ncbi:unnamed protein product, partial [Mesorhabditis belari]|uniref:Kinesin motor domain-containing protein n=1 Tax=Mesorhabditis belari TaxID=2138241 RepID=A0AAF3FBI9_9BILA
MTATSNPSKTECVKVVVRCRPLSHNEVAQGHQSIISMDTKRGVIELKNPKELNEPTKDFTFDAIYDGSSKQMELYDETFRDLVESVLNGFNGTIFAYGQTGTGKTYTMEGLEKADERGVIHNSFEHIFNHIARSHDQQYLVRASYLEIYQEEIRDLLNKDSKTRLELKERPDVGVYVKDLSSFVTKSVEEIQHVMRVGNANRSVGRTDMNEHSSRSHAIFMITVECSEIGVDGENHIRVGRLNLVDLAGSERQAKTGATGERFKEATKINLSLSALGNVISALVDGRSTHIPYRDSKLTRLLQDSLGGNSKTVMVACIGPASYNFEESLGTLRYANRAKNIKNKPKINEDPKDALLREFQEEIDRLRAMLATRKRRGKEEIGEEERKIEREREAINEDGSIRKEEKRRMLAEIEERARMLEEERNGQAEVTAKIEQMQSKLLSGGMDLLDHTRRQRDELETKRVEIAERKRREREMLQQLEQQEESVAELDTTFTSLRQEVEAKTRKLKKLSIKLQKARRELQDIHLSHSDERRELERDVSQMNMELKLKLLIVENFIPFDVADRVRSKAIWDDETHNWNLPGARPLSQDSKVPTRPATAGQALLVDGLLSRSTGGDSGVCGSDIDQDRRDILANRPLSLPGLRRPMSVYERLRIEKAREKLEKTKRIPLTSTSNENFPLTQGTLPEEILRFCGENVLVFTDLERLETRTLNNSSCYNQDHLSSSRIEIDVSKLGSRLNSMRLERHAATAPIQRPRSVSKNGRARSALGKATNEEKDDGQNHTNTKVAVSSSLYPKARGLENECDEQPVMWILEDRKPSTSSASSESEGICADFPPLNQQMPSSFHPSSIFGPCPNLQMSIDFNEYIVPPLDLSELVISSGRRCVSMPRENPFSENDEARRSPSVSPMSSSFYNFSPRRTQIPRPILSASFSVSNESRKTTRRSQQMVMSAPCGSREQLCEHEDKRRMNLREIARETIERSLQGTPRTLPKGDLRCLLSVSGNHDRSRSPNLLSSNLRTSSQFIHSSSSTRLLNRPRMSQFETEQWPRLSRRQSTDPMMNRSYNRMNENEQNPFSPNSLISFTMESSIFVDDSSMRSSKERKGNPTKKTLIHWRSRRTKCDFCRLDSLLRARRGGNELRHRNSNGFIGKIFVARRHRCRCAQSRQFLHSNLLNSIPSSSPHLNLDSAIFFALLALIFRVLLAIFE